MFRNFIIILFCFFILTLSFSTLHAEQNKKATFVDTILTTSEDDLLFFAMLKNSFSEQMVQGVKSGIPFQFSFFVTLEGVKENWPDQELMTMEFKHTLTYDTLKESYNVELEEKGHRVITSQYLSETQKIMGEINGLEIIALKDLQVDTTYKLKFRAVLNKKTLPMGLHKVTPFISWWDIETDWQEIEFTY